MKRMIPLAVLAPAALLVALAGASMKAAPSGDTCTASGSGPTYTLRISLPPGAQQFGFAFGADGAAVTNAVIPGANGNFTTEGLAANTTGAWLSDAPLPSSSVVTGDDQQTVELADDRSRERDEPDLLHADHLPLHKRDRPARHLVRGRDSPRSGPLRVVVAARRDSPGGGHRERPPARARHRHRRGCDGDPGAPRCRSTGSR